MLLLSLYLFNLYVEEETFLDIYNLGLVHLDRRENERALHWFQRAIQANPNDRDARRFVEQLAEGEV
jgi:tetratricopeptide (TPR) repeat protein